MKMKVNTVIDASTPPILSVLCILALLPLAESVPPSSLAAALAAARVVEPAGVVRALTEVIRIDATTRGGWLADLRAFDGPERQELSDLLRGEGVGLADRSKLRQLATGRPAATQSTIGIKDNGIGYLHDGLSSQPEGPRRAQDGREESATATQLRNQQGNQAGTAQLRSERADNGTWGLSSDSASLYKS
jgi:hypothetical protein